jgi:alpha-1,3-rhamnosyl/mannosyltransferase
VIAVEASRLLRDVRGIGRYVRAMLPRLLAQRPGATLQLFARDTFQASLLREWVAAEETLRWRTQVRLTNTMALARADLFWYPWNIVEHAPAQGAVVATVHDIAPVALPDPRWTRVFRNLRSRRRYDHTTRRATLMLTPSQFTADELERVFGVEAARTRVVPLAADDFVAQTDACDREVLMRHGVASRPFILAVGVNEARKNLSMIRRALSRVVASHPDLTLVFAGPRRVDKPRDRDQPWERTLGFISDSDLAALYRHATALVCSSHYEGFGLPLLEAMQAGTPVISAWTSSLPEVAGDAASWVEPDDDGAMAAAVDRVLTDDRLRRTMRDAGRRRAAQFSWDTTAERTLAVFDEARVLVGGRG